MPGLVVVPLVSPNERPVLFVWRDGVAVRVEISAAPAMPDGEIGLPNTLQLAGKFQTVVVVPTDPVDATARTQSVNGTAMIYCAATQDGARQAAQILMNYPVDGKRANNWDRSLDLADRILDAIRDPNVIVRFPAVGTASQALDEFIDAASTEHIVTDLDFRLKLGALGTGRIAYMHALELDGLPPPTSLTLDATLGMSPAMRAALYRGSHSTLLAIQMIEWIARLELLGAFSRRCMTPGRMGHGHSGSSGNAWRVLAQFLYLGGGFLLASGEDEEFLGNEVGIGRLELTEALATLELLVPAGIDGPWMREVEGIHWLSLVPFPIQGIGVTNRNAWRHGWQAPLSGAARRYLAERAGAAEQLMPLARP